MCIRDSIRSATAHCWSRHLEYPLLIAKPDEVPSEHYIVCTFPILFPYTTADFLLSRQISSNVYFKYLIQYSDQRFTKDAWFRLFATSTLMW